MEIINTLRTLSEGGLILYPTDTVWGIGGDATRADVVHKVFNLKNRADSKALICLVDSKTMLRQYVAAVPNKALELMRVTRPTTVIFNQAKGFAKNAVANDGSIAIRIPKHSFCLEIIRAFGKPILSTSANISGEPTPDCFSSIDPKILEGVDYIVPLQQQTIMAQSSRILKIKPDGAIQILRP